MLFFLEGISRVCFFSQVQSELLSTALAIAALRRCFGPTSALVVTWINRLFQIRGRRGKFVCILSGQIIATSHDLTPKWWFSKGHPLNSGKPRLVKYLCLMNYVLYDDIINISMSDCILIAVYLKRESPIYTMNIKRLEALDLCLFQTSHK